MATTEVPSASGFTAIPRMVVSAAAGMVSSVKRAMVGETRVRTARGNAWEAICADRARARHRDETRRLVAALAARAENRALAAQVAVGSSPRSSASQTSLASASPDRFG